MNSLSPWPTVAILALSSLLLAPPSAPAEEKLILLERVPRPLFRLKVAPDGKRIYAAGTSYFVLDASGRLVDQFDTPQGSYPKDLIPLPTGGFLACNTYGGGHLALWRPDGTEARQLVAKGGDEKQLRADGTGWTSPAGAAVDAERKRIFVLDLNQAPSGTPSPSWSRIAIFDFDGKYHGDINRYDGNAKEKDDARRTWYDDIAVDARRQRVYVTAQRTQEVLAFRYDGKLLGRVKTPGAGGLAVLPDGRVAQGAGRTVTIFTPNLKPERKLALPPEVSVAHEGIYDLESDAAGRLYAVVGDPSVTFLRWSPNLDKVEVVGPRFLRLDVTWPNAPAVAGKPLTVPVKIAGRPAPEKQGPWQALIRPSDGSDLRWRPLAAAYHDGILTIETPADLRGLHDVAIRLGNGPIALTNRANDPVLQKTIAFGPAGVTASIAVLPSLGRRAFRQGEAIPLQFVRRTETPGSAEVTLSLMRNDRTLATATLSVETNTSAALPAAVTRRLVPGTYRLVPKAKAHESYPLMFDIAAAANDSPMQRILYHEFDRNPPTWQQPNVGDTAERMAFIRNYVRAAANLGFTRETDRMVWLRGLKHEPDAWRRDRLPVDVARPGFAPADYYAVPLWGNAWEAEAYLDAAVRRGLVNDSQLLGHCSGVRFRDEWLAQCVPALQRTAQRLGRYPSFYGFNYNDEMFFGGFATDWTKADDDWLKRVEAEKFAGRPHAETLLYALGVMYDRFNTGVREVNPRLKLTATPMWQFPAVEGSYAPAVFRGLSESYSHFLSEGYSLPWNPAHSADFLRRPGLPLMGVFDNGTRRDGGEAYLKNTMQVLARGVQGIGVEHTRPFDDPLSADAYRTANRLARIYGPIFAETPPANEAAVLYSWSQDVTEKRNMMGTPHWERVYTLYSAGLMAGVPMEIVYEEDLSAGLLVDKGKPRVPMLFLVGQTQPLPQKVREQLARFVAAGGKLFIDADSRLVGNEVAAVKLGIKTHELKSLFYEGYAGDTFFPLAQPVLEKLAADLKAAVANHRRFPMDTNDPWVSKNQFDGGAVRYLMLAAETSPYPWDAGTVWSLGTMYSKSGLPRSVELSFPATKGVVYDVFEGTIVEPAAKDGKATLTVDLTLFPGRLYALAPARLEAPQVEAGLRDGVLHYRIRAVAAKGQALAARVPVRIRLTSGNATALEIYRSTGPDGTFADSVPLPAVPGAWSLEVTELLGGQGSVATLPDAPPLPALLLIRPDVEPQRITQLENLLREAKNTLLIAPADEKALTPAQWIALCHALQKRGIDLKSLPALPAKATPGVYLVCGDLKHMHPPGTLLSQAAGRGLFAYPLSESVPGAGHGLFTPVYAMRGDREHAIALIGGDASGLNRTVARFIDYLEKPDNASVPVAAGPIAYTIKSEPRKVAPVGRLSERVGARLAGVTVSADGKHLVVTADGYLRNLALIEDDGSRARMVRSVRVGQAPKVGSAFVSDDGRLFGASGRETARIGQAFPLAGADGKQDVFAAFGDMGWHQNRFTVSARGDVVLAPGTHGVVCWKRDGDHWKESWAIDFWKEFARLDWPVSQHAERIPQFHAVIPHGADYALVLYGEFTNNGWVTPDHHCGAWLAAVALADGKELWRVDVPIPKTQLFPTLHVSPDGAQVLLQVQMGSWDKETFRFFRVAEGKIVGQWDTPTWLQAAAVADVRGWSAQAYKNRLLEVRRQDGTLVHNCFWDDQPVSLAFAPNGWQLFVADDAGRLTSVDELGRVQWQTDLGCVASLATAADKVYAAGQDGRLRCFGGDGKLRWTLDCTPALRSANPMGDVAAAKIDPARLHEARREPTTTAAVPDGDNLLRTGKATLKLGGTPGWMSAGKVQVTAEELTNGKDDDVVKPWLHLNEVFWDSQAGRQVWAEITFPTPTDVKALTVRENAKFPDSWPTQGLVQVWDAGTKSWKTAAMGVFLKGPVNTYRLNLKGVTRLRYLPWHSYYRNFYTSEIEVR